MARDLTLRHAVQPPVKRRARSYAWGALRPLARAWSVFRGGRHASAMPVVEEYEQRLMYSADLAPHALLLASATQPVEQRVINAQGEFVASQTPAAAQRVELLIVDTGVTNSEILLNQLSSADGRKIEVLTLDSATDGISQISAALAGRSDISALHILSHGADGELQLGSSTLDATELAARSAEIARWGDALNENADILIYGCDVAADAKGEAFVQQLSALTRADVAASTNVTGNTKLGADWNLEYTTGPVESDLALTAAARDQWLGTLLETLANTTTAGTQTDAAIATNPTNSSFVVTWTGPDSGGQGVFARLYDAAGNPTAAEFLVNTTTAGGQQQSTAGMAADGSFVVAWTSANQDGNGNGVYAQRFDAAGTKVGGEVLVNQTVAGNQAHPAIAVAANGQFVVAWDGPGASGNDVFVRHFDSAGVALSSELGPATTTAGNQTAPAVAIDGSGNYAVAWTSDTGGNGKTVFVQLFSSADATVGGEIKVNTTDAQDQDSPTVGMASDGRFVIAWRSQNQDTNNDGVYAQRYAASGAPAGTEFRVNTTIAGAQNEPAAAMDANGNFVVAWTSNNQDGSNLGVYAQRYLADGSANGSEFLVNTTTANAQSTPAVALTTTRMVVAWDGNGIGDNAGVFWQNYIVGVSPPVATHVLAGANNLPAIDEDPLVNPGMLVTALLAGHVTDTNTSALSGIAVIAVDNSNGVWQYSTDGGGLWNVFGNPDASSARLLAADSDNLVRFVPNADFNGVVANGLTFYAWDQTTGIDGSTGSITTGSASVRDNFDTVAYNNNDGTTGSTWSANWTETGDDGSATSGGISISGGVLKLATAGLLGGSGSISRAVNLTGSTSATLTFSYDNQLTALLATNTVTVQVSNGGAPTTVATFDPGTNTGSGTISFTIPIGLIGTNTTLKFADTSSGVAPGGSLSIDDLQILYNTAPFSSATAASGITVNSINDAPVNTVPGAQTVNEDTALAFSGVNTISVNDVDGNLASTRLVVANGTLNVSLAGGAAIGPGANGSNTLTLTGTQTQISAALATLSYQGNLDYNGPDTLTIVSADSASTPLNDTDTVAITVSPVNDAPTAINLNAAETYTEDTALNLTGIVTGDVDSANITATLTLSNTAAGTLSTATSGAVTSNYVAATGVWTASGAIANVNALLAGVTFNPAANFNANFTIATSVSDGVAAAITGVKTMTGVAVNDAPVVAIPAAQSVNEDATLTFSGGNGNAISISDVDAGSGSLLLTLSMTNGTLTLNGTTGLTLVSGGSGSSAMQYTGTLTDINAALNGMFYTPTANFNGGAGMGIAAGDQGNTGSGGALSDTKGLGVTVNPVNDAPVNTVPGAQTVNEDTALTFGGINTISVNDVDGNLATTQLTVDNGTLNVSLAGGATIGAGANGGTTMTLAGTQVQINAALTTLSYQGVLNFNGTDTLTVISTDSAGTPLNDSDTVTINVTPVNDAPVLDIAKSPALTAINEDAGAPSGAVGTLVSALVDLTSPSGQLDNVSDPDSGALSGIAVTAVDSANGTWWYSANAGANWNALGPVTQNNALLLAADANTRLYFQPNANFNGTLANAITFRAWDQTSGVNGGTANTATTATVLDQFNSVSYSNNDGTVNWTGAWTEIDSNGGGVNGGRIRVQGGTVEIRTDSSGDGISRVANLAGAIAATLSFDYANSIDPGGTIQVRVSANGGGSYTTLDSFTNTVHSGTGTLSFDITPFIAANTAVQFIVSSSAGGGGSTLTLDNVAIAFSSGTATGASTAFSTASDTASLVVNAVNDAPVAIVPGVSYSAIEQTALNLKSTGLSVSDVDSLGASETVTLSVTEGTLNVTAGASGATVAGSGSSAVTLTGTLAQINALLNTDSTSTVSYIDNTDTPSSSTPLTLAVNDNGNTGSGGAKSSSASAPINIAAVNDAPVANIPGVSYSATEQTALSLKNTGLSVSDVDSLGASETVTLSVTEGTLNVTAGASGATVAGSGSSTVTLSGTLAQINVLLNTDSTSTVGYIDNTDTPSSSTALTLGVNDNGNTGSGGAKSGSASGTINIAAVNDAPVNTAPGAQTVNEDTALTFTGLNTISFNDVDGNLATTRLTAANGTLNVSLAGGAGISAGANGSATLTLSGTKTQINSALGTLSYQPNLDFNGTDSLQIVTNDLGNTGAGGALSDTDSVSINVTPVNDAPVLDPGKSPAMTAINEDAGAPSGAVGTLVSALVDLTSPSGQLDNVSDPDSGALSGIAVTAVDGANGTWWYSTNAGAVWNAAGAVTQNNALLLAADANTRLTFQPNANFNGTLANAITFRAWDQTSGVNGTSANLSLASTVLDQFNAVAYTNNDGTASWTTPWAETDSGGGSAAGGGQIQIIAGQLAIRADATNDQIHRQVNLSGATTATLSFDYSNPLSGGDSVQIRVSNNGGGSYTTLDSFTNTVHSGTGTLSFDITPYIASNTTVQFIVTATGDNRTLLLDNVAIAFGTATGGSTAFSSATDTASLVVIAVNDAPVITSNGGTANATIGVSENVSAVTTVTATDIDLPAQTLTYSISGGADATKFAINGSTGVLNFVTAPDFEIPTDAGANNVYDVIVQASDGTLTDAQAIAVTVTAVNDNNPVITSNGGGASVTISVAENSTAVTTVTATDADLPAQSLSYSISGGSDAAKFNIDTTTGILSFISAPNFEVPTDANGDNLYNVTVQASDGTLTATQAIAVTATNINEAPVAALPASLSATEQIALNLKNSGISLSDVDASGGNVTVTLSVGEGTLTITPGSSGVASVAGSGTHNVTINGNIFQINDLFNNAATGTLSYLDSTDTPSASTTLTLAINDNGNTGSGGPLTASATSTINITAVNDAPTATNLNTSETYAENSALDLSDIVVSDVDGPSITAMLTLSNAAAGSLNTATSGAVTSTYVTATGVWTASGAITDINDVNALLAGLTFTPALNFNSNFSIATRVSDGVAAAITGVKDMTGVAANTAPTATNLDAPEIYTEDTLLNLKTIVVSDVDSPNVTATLTLSNKLAGSMSTTTAGSVTSVYDAATGMWRASGAIADVNALLAAVTFNPATDFNADFNIAVTVSDGIAAAITGIKNVTGTPVNDAPVTTPVTLTAITEDSGARLITQSQLLANASDVDSVLLSATGLAISSGAGTLLDNNDGTWNYTPALNDDTAVSFSYTVSDGSLSTTGSASLDITPVNDAPVTIPVTLTPIAEDSGARLITQSELLANASDVDSVLLSATGLAISSGAGTLLDNNDGTWNYTPALNDDTAVSFSYTVSDGSLNATGSASLDITPVNDAPVVTVPGVQTIAQDTALTIAGVSVTDVDDNLASIQLTVVNGTLDLTPAGSAVLTGNSSAALTLSGTQSDINDTLITLKYQGGLNFAGADTLTVLATDAAGASDTQTIGITVGGVNNVAVIGGATTGNVTEDAALTLTTGGALTIADPDFGQANFAAQAGTAGIFGMFSVDNAGTWTYSASNNQTTIQQLASGATLTDTFTVVSVDGSASQDVTITITGVNDTAVIGGVTTGAVTEDAAPMLTTTGALTISDADSGQSSFAAQTSTAGAYGTFSIDATGNWNYAAANNQPVIQQLTAGAILTDTFNVVSSDGSASQNVVITITGVDEAPVLTNTGATVNEGASVTLTSAMLQVNNAGSGATSITYTVRSAPADGTLQLDAIALAAGDTFSQADIDNGKVSYTHDGSETVADHFNFAVADAQGAMSGPATFTLTILPVNDAPIAADQSVSTLDTTSVAFHPGDFGYADAEGDKLAKIRVTALPDSGTLVLASNPVVLNQEIAATDLAAGSFKYVPHLGIPTKVFTTFGFQVSDGTAYSDGHTVTVAVEPGLVPGPNVSASVAVTTPPAVEPPAPVVTTVTTPATKVTQAAASADSGLNKAAPTVTNAELAFTPVNLLGTQPLQQGATRAQGFDEPLQGRNAVSGTSLPPGFITFTPATGVASFTSENLKASELSTAGRIASATSSPAFTRELDRAREGALAAEELQRNIIVSSVTAGAGMSVGYVFWLLRGGLLLTTLLSSLPAWRFVDPLPVLGRLKGDEEDDDYGDEDGESLESIVGGDDARAPDSTESTRDQRNV